MYDLGELNLFVSDKMWLWAQNPFLHEIFLDFSSPVILDT